MTRRLLYLLLFATAALLLLFAVSQPRFADADRAVIRGVETKSDGLSPASGNEAEPVERKVRR